MKSGFVCLTGRPNVGKSTLINTIVNEKIAITSNKPQTTRNVIQGIYNDEDSQIVFVDTPGIHKPVHKLGHALNNQAYYSIEDVDIIVFVVDASVPLGGGDIFVIERIKEEEKPKILVLNKIDKISNDQILLKIDEYKDLAEFDEIVPISANSNDNIDRLIKVIKEYLPDSVRYFSETDKTSNSLEFTLTELVREKIIEETEDEVPHSTACTLESIEEKDDICNIYIDIIVDRDSLRKIILGKNGDKIKAIGSKAREEMERHLNKKVYLELYVKTIKKWREKERHLKEIGYSIKNN